MRAFSQPSGVVDVQLDKATNRLATPNCTDNYTSAFVAGTEPRDTCEAQQGLKGFLTKMFGGDKPVMPAQDPNAQDRSPRRKRASSARLPGCLRMTKARLRCLNHRTVGRTRERRALGARRRRLTLGTHQNPRWAALTVPE